MILTTISQDEPVLMPYMVNLARPGTRIPAKLLNK